MLDRNMNAGIFLMSKLDCVLDQVLEQTYHFCFVRHHEGEGIAYHGSPALLYEKLHVFDGKLDGTRCIDGVNLYIPHFDPYIVPERKAPQSFKYKGSPSI